MELRHGERAGRELDLFLHRAKFQIVPLKGRHSAGLNFGDCFSYALARSRGDTLLFKGQDFTRSDIRPAYEQPA